DTAVQPKYWYNTTANTLMGDSNWKGIHFADATHFKDTYSMDKKFYPNLDNVTIRAWTVASASHSVGLSSVTQNYIGGGTFLLGSGSSKVLVVKDGITRATFNKDTEVPVCHPNLRNNTYIGLKRYGGSSTNYRDTLLNDLKALQNGSYSTLSKLVDKGYVDGTYSWYCPGLINNSVSYQTIYGPYLVDSLGMFNTEPFKYYTPDLVGATSDQQIYRLSFEQVGSSYNVYLNKYGFTGNLIWKTFIANRNGLGSLVFPTIATSPDGTKLYYFTRNPDWRSPTPYWGYLDTQNGANVAAVHPTLTFKMVTRSKCWNPYDDDGTTTCSQTTKDTYIRVFLGAVKQYDIAIGSGDNYASCTGSSCIITESVAASNLPHQASANGKTVM
ncbi:hypothetical protein, partial [Paenibacillus sp. y28]|uniref:hypothetical protein n=1 Tax=Paenibacillus sp. y28 TaxID=3129110 RepID=UPI0030168BC7